MNPTSPTNHSPGSAPLPRGPLFSRFQLQAERARRWLREFVAQAWPVLEPDTPLVDGIHVSAICEHLQALTEGRIRNLIINVPPGHTKSLLTCVFWPAWVWICHPEARWLFSSYRQPLATRDSVKCRRLIASAWYQERWGRNCQLASDQNQKDRFENTRTGYRLVVPLGAGTGERGDYVVVDDPHSVDQAESDAQRQGSIEWWNGSMATRLNDFATGHKVVIQQRLHEADLTGDLLQKGGLWRSYFAKPSNSAANSGRVGAEPTPATCASANPRLRFPRWPKFPARLRKRSTKPVCAWTRSFPG